ncbi:RRQRL motif-containing zinc-binding protein [Nocardia sp. CC227C]|uniref:RRQRL motif-containing zinc-binding protein n=1 Tax=Nocardia sp. CC227C TaxID=3044562 RepID=UPI00278C57C2|nr:RRQRL motif-containing zinc-binding protein [Nocardia sp. CC227C]
MIGPKDVRARELPDPDGSRFGVPTYYWGTAPDGLATRDQLKAEGLQPNRQGIAAQVLRPRRGGREPLAAYLFQVAKAAPKRPAHPNQLEALARANHARAMGAMVRRGIDPTPEPPQISESPWEPAPPEWEGFDR